MNSKNFLLLILFAGQFAFAKGPDRSANGAMEGVEVWAGFGRGTHTIKDPKDDIYSNGSYFVDLGFTAPLIGHGPIYFTAGATIGYNSGKMQYNYTNENVNYKSADMPYWMTNLDARAGLGIRLVNASVLHLYIEGGGMIRNAKIIYDTKTDTNLDTTGSKYQKEQSDIVGTGSYAEVGVDILLFNSGFRIAGRAAQGSTSNVKALNDRRMFYKEGIGYFALVRQF